jgi:glutamine synthetase
VNLAYSQRNRSAACRIPVYSLAAKAKRIEFRPPDPAANPYLAFSPMMMAGLDGIQQRIDPGLPVDKDLIETWIDYKRSAECDPVRVRPHPGEFALYYDV